MMGQNMVSGEIINKDQTSITIKLKDGGSKIVFLTNKTTIQKTTEGTLGDLIIGNQITANGQSNTDGSLNATLSQQRLLLKLQGTASTTNDATKR